MGELVCPKCGSSGCYNDTTVNICCDCHNEWLGGDGGGGGDVSSSAPCDSNGVELSDGDAVTVIKDLKVKGSSMVIKRGTRVRGIRLTDDISVVDCRIDGSSIVLKTCFLKK